MSERSGDHKIVDASPGVRISSQLSSSSDLHKIIRKYEIIIIRRKLVGATWHMAKVLSTVPLWVCARNKLVPSSVATQLGTVHELSISA